MRKHEETGETLAAWMGLVDAVREGFPEFNPADTFVLMQTVNGESTAVVFWAPVDGTAEVMN
jgi:hypothetical protein